MIPILLLISINLLTLYFALKKPGVALTFIFFFYIINNIILSHLGLINLRYAIILFVLVVLIATHFRLKYFLLSFKYLSKSLIFWGIILILIGMFIGIIFKNDTSKDGYEVINTFLMPTLILFFLGALMIYNQKTLSEISFGVVVFGGIFFLVFYLLVDISSISIGNRDTIEETEQFNAITLARLCGLIAIPSTIYAVYSKLGIRKFISIIITIISFYWLLVTSTRGVILSLFASLAVYFIFHFKNKKSYSFYIIITLAIGLISLGAIDLGKFGVLERFYELTAFDEGIKTSAGARYLGWIYAWELFLENPIFGLGASGYADIYGRYPHNLFFELIVEYGLFGLVAFIMIVGNGIYYVFKILYKRIFSHQVNCVLLIWLYLLLSVMFSGNLTVNRDFWIASGILISTARQLKFTTLNRSRT